MYDIPETPVWNDAATMKPQCKESQAELSVLRESTKKQPIDRSSDIKQRTCFRFREQNPNIYFIPAHGILYFFVNSSDFNVIPKHSLTLFRTVSTVYAEVQ